MLDSKVRYISSNYSHVGEKNCMLYSATTHKFCMLYSATTHMLCVLYSAITHTLGCWPQPGARLHAADIRPLSQAADG